MSSLPPSKSLKTQNPIHAKPKKISWFDMLVYKLFRWRWNTLLKSHPGILKGLYDSFGATLDKEYPGLKDEPVDWASITKVAPLKATEKNGLRLVVDNSESKAQDPTSNKAG